MDWVVGTEMEDSDSDNDDENEIRQLDAVLEAADIEVCDTGIVKNPGLASPTVGIPTTQTAASSSATVPSHAPDLLDPQALPSAPVPDQGAPANINEIQSSSTSLNLPNSSPQSLSDSTESQKLSKIDASLALNKLYEEKLQRLERILGLRLRECRVKLSEIQTNTVIPDRLDVFRYINCGRPYFRDQNNCPAPENEDAKMAKAQMYDFSLVTSVPGWTVRDKNQFTQVMTQTSLEIKKDEYNNKIKELKKLLSNDKNNANIKKQIEKLKKERDSLNIKMPFVQLALPPDQEYDWDLLAHKLNKRHTPHEYKCLWKLYFHPSINKSSWKNSEHTTLQELAGTYHHQDWDEIARKLDTGRTGYQCFVYYRTNMTSSCIGKKWTHEEVTYLKRLIDYFREDFYIPWGKIAAAMENRTKIQIYNKYLRLIEHRKGRFLPEEDAVILNCVQRFGTDFKRMTEYLAHRSMVQIRSRYNVLNKMRVSTVWTVDDDKKLVQIMSSQDSNMTFSNATKFFPGRNRVNIRSRYVTLLKWMNKYPNLDIEYAPRRGARRLNHGQASVDLNKAIENLKNTLNTEVEVKKDRKKITRDSNETDIEDAIVAILVNEAVKEQEQKRTAYEGHLVLPNEVVVTSKQLDLTNLRKCLVFLGSNLNKTIYQESRYSKDYPQLAEPNQDISLVKLKSYSRKTAVRTIQCNNTPDVWGKKILNPRNYVLPPHYATITGCKALMSHVATLAVYCNAVNLHILVRRNHLLKEHMDLLLERFYTLFLWPMLLSNESATDFHNSKLNRIDSYYTRPTALPAPAPAASVTIKTNNKRKIDKQNKSKVTEMH